MPATNEIILGAIAVLAVGLICWVVYQLFYSKGWKSKHAPERWGYSTVKRDNITLADIEKAMKEVYGDEEGFNRSMHGSKWPVGPVTPEHLQQLKAVWGQELRMLQGLGPKLYHIGGGTITGEGGWKMFNDALREAAGKYTGNVQEISGK